jgi:hypothetical protein
MVAHFMKEHVREGEVPQDWDVHDKVGHTRPENACNDVIDNDFDPSWFTLPFVVVVSETAVSKILPPLDSMGLSSADSSGVRQDDGLEAQ